MSKQSEDATDKTNEGAKPISDDKAEGVVGGSRHRGESLRYNDRPFWDFSSPPPVREPGRRG